MIEVNEESLLVVVRAASHTPVAEHCNRELNDLKECFSDIELVTGRLGDRAPKVVVTESPSMVEKVVEHLLTTRMSDMVKFFDFDELDEEDALFYFSAQPIGEQLSILNAAVSS